MTQRRIYLIQANDVSGAERMHAALIAADDRALVCCPPGSKSELFAKSLGAAVAPLRYAPLRHSGGALETVRSVFRGFRSARDVRRVLKAHPDRSIIFCTGIRPALLASLAAVGLDRSIFWCVPDYLPPPPLRHAVRLLAHTRADGGLSLSSSIADDFAGRSKVLRALVPVVHPGVPPAPRESVRPEPQLPTAAIVGHVSPVKRTDLALEIAALVARENPDFRLRVVGAPQFRKEDFALHDQLRSRSKAADLMGRIEWPGYASDVGQALQGVSALLHCRPDEPFGIVLIEAMALGIPVVAPASGGPAEIVAHGVTGYLYPPEDATAAARFLIRILGDRDLAREMGEAGRRRAQSDFSLARQLASTEALLLRLRGV